MSEGPVVRSVEVVADRTGQSRCDEGFLRVKRLTLRNTYTDGTTSPPYPCDIVSRRSVDAVAVVLWHREPDGRVLVHYRESTRPPLWLRRDKQDELPHKDSRPYDRIGEIVAGVLEPGDDGLAGVLRRGAIEAKEEAGYDVDTDHVHDLGLHGFFPSPGVTDEKVYLVSAEVDPARRGTAEGDGSVMEQGSRLVTRELKDAIRACRDGEVPDAKTELGLLRLADQLGYIPQLDCFVSDLPPDLQTRYDSLGITRADGGAQARS